MSTKRSLRRQALYLPRPDLSVTWSGEKTPVSRPARGDKYKDRNPAHDTEPRGQEEGPNPIRAQLRQKGVA